MVSDSLIYDEKILTLARQAAHSALRSGRGILPEEDLIGEANYWIVKNAKRVTEWLERGKHGENMIRHAARAHCLQKVATERRKKSRLEQGDLFYYTVGIIKEVLPDIFDMDDWSSSSQTAPDEMRRPSAPSEGNNRLAVIVDVRAAFLALPDPDQTLLHDLYADGGVTREVLAMAYEVTERTIRRREERAIDRMIERLGGLPPWA